MRLGPKTRAEAELGSYIWYWSGMKRNRWILAAVLTILNQPGWSHEKHGKGKAGTPMPQAPVKPESKAAAPEPIELKLKRINELYVKDVRPIFQQKCAPCHSAGSPLPWYSGLPVAKQIIQKDIREAREHIDMTRDFPFGGHGTPESDLDALEQSLEKGIMPPLRYRVMHPGSGVTAQELARIRSWIRESRNLLKSH